MFGELECQIPSSHKCNEDNNAMTNQEFQRLLAKARALSSEELLDCFKTAVESYFERTTFGEPEQEFVDERVLKKMQSASPQVFLREYHVTGVLHGDVVVDTTTYAQSESHALNDMIMAYARYDGFPVKWAVTPLD